MVGPAREVSTLETTAIQKVSCGGVFSVALIGSTLNMLKPQPAQAQKRLNWDVKYNVN
jgi:hypothetical protein